MTTSFEYYDDDDYDISEETEDHKDNAKYAVEEVAVENKKGEVKGRKIKIAPDNEPMDKDNSLSKGEKK